MGGDWIVKGEVNGNRHPIRGKREPEAVTVVLR